MKFQLGFVNLTLRLKSMATLSRVHSLKEFRLGLGPYWNEYL